MFGFWVWPQNVLFVRVAAFSPNVLAATHCVPTGFRPAGFMIVVSGSGPEATGGVVGEVTGEVGLIFGLGVWLPPPPPPPPFPPDRLVATTMTTMSTATRPPAMRSPRLLPRGLTGPPGAPGMIGPVGPKPPPAGCQPPPPGWPAYPAGGWP